MSDQKELIQIAGAMDLETAQKSQKMLNNYIATQMKEGVDFGTIPGTKKPGLWQPGAQKLLYFNGLGVKMICVEKIANWDKPFFYYEYKAIAFHKGTGLEVAECIGSANSKEDRYAWRWVGEKYLPKGLDKEDYKSKTGNNGWVSYRIPNEDIFTQVNTMQKIAQKRAMIGVATLACRASENFTTDVEEDERTDQPGPADAKPVTNTAPPAEEPHTDPALISFKQRKLLEGTIKRNDITQGHLKSFLEDTFPYVFDDKGKVHLSLIKKGPHFNEILKFCGHEG